MMTRWLFLTVATLIVPITAARPGSRLSRNALRAGARDGRPSFREPAVAGKRLEAPSYSAPPLEREAGDLYGQPLVERGYTVFSLHRATPRFQFPAPLEDVQRAVRFVPRCGIGIDPDHWRCWRLSGGHLVSMLGVLDGHGDSDDRDPVNRVSAKVQTVVARAAPADLARIETTNGRGAIALLPLPSQDLQAVEAGRYREASPVNYTSTDDPPILLLRADETVPFEQAELATRLGQRKWRLASYRFPARVMDRHSLARWTRQTTSAQ